MKLESNAYSSPAGSLNDDGISLVEILNAILRHWRMVIVLPFTLALAVGIWTYSQDRTYLATATFVPQGAEGRQAGGAAALAQQFGVNVGSQQPGESPQFYVDLIESMTVLRRVVESQYEIETAAGMRRGTLIELMEVEPSEPQPLWRTTAEALSESIATMVAPETGIVRVSVATFHPMLSEAVTLRILEILSEFNVEVRQNRAAEEGRFIAARVAETQAELSAAERALQDFLRQNREFMYSPDLLFEHERLQRQLAMRQEVYTSLVRSEQQARIDAIRDTPLLTIIDNPVGSTDPESRGTVTRSLAALVIGLVLALLLAFVREIARRSREADRPGYREFKLLASEAWGDMRRPWRWLSIR